MSFRDQNVEMQYLVKELAHLRAHNLQTVLDMELLLFAEGAVVLLALERFLRVILAEHASDSDTLPNLLQKACSKRLQLLVVPTDDAQEFINSVTRVRNTLAHANYEQAAKETNSVNAREYFKKHYTPEIERLTEYLDMFMQQIDVETGKPYPRKVPEQQ